MGTVLSFDLRVFVSRRGGGVEHTSIHTHICRTHLRTLKGLKIIANAKTRKTRRFFSLELTALCGVFSSHNHRIQQALDMHLTAAE